MGIEESQDAKNIVVGVIGVGYVGLPLAICFSDKFRVYAYDISVKKIESLKNGISYIDDVTDEMIKKSLGKSFFPTTSEEDLKNCNYIMIAVPTPIDEDNNPNLLPVIESTKTLSKVLQKGQTVILESTTYPGTVEEVMAPILEKSGLKFKKDFFMAYSPERIDPGNKKNTIYNTPKIVGGCDKDTTKRVRNIYQSVISAPIITVSSIRAAEATKIFENVFRAVNIALVNELSLVFDNMGINIWEVINAASTKPMGFMAHYPGIGVGGHCIPVDPYYLSFKARKMGHTTRFIELAGEINSYMPIHTSYLVSDALSKIGMDIESSRVTVLGVAYKPDTYDTRDSPSLDLISHLMENVGEIKYYDPYVPSVKIGDTLLESCRNIDEALDCDCLVLAVAHNKFLDHPLEELILKYGVKAVVDGKNILKKEMLKGIIYKCIGNGERI